MSEMSPEAFWNAWHDAHVPVRPALQGAPRPSFNFPIQSLQAAVEDAAIPHVAACFPHVAVAVGHDSYALEIPAGPFEQSLRGWVRIDDGALLDTKYVCQRCVKPVMAEDGCQCLTNDVLTLHQEGLVSDATIRAAFGLKEP